MCLIESCVLAVVEIPYMCGTWNLVGMNRVVHPGMLLASMFCSAEVDEKGLLL